MPKSESEPVVGGPQLQYADVDAFLRMAERVENRDLLFAQTGEAQGAAVHDRTWEKQGKRIKWTLRNVQCINE